MQSRENTLINQQTKKNKNLWFERLMAIIATCNLVIVIFDLTYIPLRDFWLYGKVNLINLELGIWQYQGIEIDILPRSISKLVTKYDVIKDIQPHRETAKYLEQVNKLKQALKTESWDSPLVQNILTDLQLRSIEMIDTNPFQLANKTGTLEKIKNIMREYLPNPEDSAKKAFITFWSSEYLKNNTQEKLEFFEKKISPLIATNYYRPIGENGKFIDNFILIDIWFVIIFAIEFFWRTWRISRTHVGVKWFDAMLWRWYDLFLIMSFWRWLRVIPVLVRLHQAKLINLNAIQKQLSQGFVATIAEDVTEIVMIRIINQLQLSITRGAITKLLNESSSNPYIDLNDTNEIAEIVRLLLELITYEVLPAIEPDVEKILEYTITKNLNQTPLYQQVKFLPGLDNLQHNLTENLVTRVYQSFNQALKFAIKRDEKLDQLLENLANKITTTLTTKIQAKESINRIEYLLNGLLEEIKINYIQQLSQEDIEQILEQTRLLRQITNDTKKSEDRLN